MSESMFVVCLIPSRYIAVHGSEVRALRDSILDRDKLRSSSVVRGPILDPTDSVPTGIHTIDIHPGILRSATCPSHPSKASVQPLPHLLMSMPQHLRPQRCYSPSHTSPTLQASTARSYHDHLLQQV